MDELLAMLKENFPGIDFENEDKLYEKGLLDSVSVVEIISEIEDMYDISVSMEYIQPQYFESVSAMWDMIQELS
ncbi:MAG: acyl carrier protein [Ruminococcaceae bacterium]|nr:acyl carrier protein [Oscillospiraceae bacterium]